MTKSLRRHEQSTTDNKNYDSVSWDECRRWRVSTQMWRAEEDCSRPERRRPGKLGRRRLPAGYRGLTELEIKLTEE